MLLSGLITVEAIIPSLRVGNKAAALQDMSETAAGVSAFSPGEILSAVVQRERLGSTGVGDGVALPHGKLERCDRVFGVFARLEKPIEFDAVDGAPVDILFMLIASEAAGADHLKALARVARFFRDPKVGAQLRATRDATSLFAILSRSDRESHAA